MMDTHKISKLIWEELCDKLPRYSKLMDICSGSIQKSWMSPSESGDYTQDFDEYYRLTPIIFTLCKDFQKYSPDNGKLEELLDQYNLYILGVNTGDSKL